MRRVAVEPRPDAGRPYEILVGIGLADAAADLRELADPPAWALVSDATVASLYADVLAAGLGAGGAAVEVATFPAGEGSKTRETVARVQDRLIEAGVGRDGWIVALGGGVVGDVAGFVAATLFRGVALVQVPTTLLAMVDSSVGGKTGVDTVHGKNLVGAFHRPRRVLVDLAVLDTLADAELRAGLAEVIKYGVILDAELFAALEDGVLDACLERDRDQLARVVEDCCRTKARVVERDERESGYREILNFGHTVAHAVEAVAGFGLRHGEAVAIGMVAEARLAEETGVARAGCAERIRRLCRRAGLPVDLPEGVEVDEVVAAARADKKVRRGRIRCSLPEAPGRMATGDEGVARPVEADDLARALTAGL